VEFNYGGAISPCAEFLHPEQARYTARVAKDEGDCTPPSHTKITRAKEINGNTVSFRFTARHASRFECVLRRNNAQTVSRRCRSRTTYANLPPGHYVFSVTAVNRAGIDRKPARGGFTIR
jgi:hypothetical protein